MSAVHAFLTRLLNVLRRNREDREQDEELAFHLEMEAEKNYSAGMSRPEARRQAAIAFGGMSRFREQTRDERLPGWLSGLSLDLKLGARMLWKYPGLAIVGGLGLAVAITIAATSFGVIRTVTNPALPLDEGERIVSVVNRSQPGGYGDRTHLHDLQVWRESVPALEDLGAARTVNRNLIGTDGRIDPVRVVEMTSEGFRIARVPPLMGRYLTEEDDLPGAAPVVVLGYDEWQARFGGRPDVIGETLRLNHTVHEVVGVMPEGFRFPTNNGIWTPLRLDPLEFPRAAAPPVGVFGRLAPGASLEGAQNQLASVASRLAADYPTTHERMRTTVMPYAISGLDFPELKWVLYILQFVITGVLVVIGLNVAVLLYARTVNRHAEMVVRTALGASRARIVGQLFAEALVLSSSAAIIGLLGARYFLRQIDARVLSIGGGQAPFWWRFALTPSTAAYVAGLAVLAAIIVGAIPAWKATASQSRGNLQRLGAGGTAPQLGRLWTGMVILQIAGAVAFLPIATNLVVRWFAAGLPAPTYATEQVLTASIAIEPDAVTPPPDGRIELSYDGRVVGLDPVRYASVGGELVRRLEAEPGVSHVVAMAMSPWTDPDPTLELAGGAAGGGDGTVESSRAATPAGWSQVEPDFFEALGMPVLQGRDFEAADAAPGATSVIVNQPFVDRVLSGGNPIGRNLRTAARGGSERHEPGSILDRGWYTIVGVVPELGSSNIISEPKVYQATIPRWTAPISLAIRVRGDDVPAFANRVRQIAFELDPSLRLGNLTTVAEQVSGNRSDDRLIVLLFSIFATSTLLLSLGGLYVIVAFTVARRRREIGIRAALGAQPHRLLGSVLGRVAAQLAFGIAAGLVVASLLDRLMGGEFLTGQNGLLLTGVAAAMVIAGMLAGWGPARAGLRVQPSEALRAD